MDEPENHIDIFGRQIVIDMMKNFRGCLVFVSHDQDLINSVTNRIIEVVEEKLVSYTGTYDFYLEEKEKQRAAREREWKHHNQEVKRLDALVKRMREWVKKNPDLGRQLRARKTQLERLTDNAPRKPTTESRMKLSMYDVDQKRNKLIVRIEGFSLTLGDKKLFDRADAYMTFGQKVAIVGRNGTGKTALLKTIMGDFVPDSGSVRLGVDIAVGYFSQDNREALDEDKTPLQVLSDVINGPEYKLRSILSRFLIGENAYNRPIRTLSGGQKTRLRFCLLFNRPNELLLLDEPTNHLDNTSWDVLVQAVTEFNGTILMVSHDRVFIDQTATKLWTIEDSQIKGYVGTLTEYLSE
jgi:ATPase subunit of ABC transporter with duplicated ATPase domains